MNNLNIYKRKDGRFEGRVYLGKDNNGKRIFKSYYGKTESEVTAKYEAAIKSISPCQISVQMTVKELTKEWLTVMSTRIRESTAANYCMKARKHIIPSFGDKYISDLDARSIHDFISDKLKCGLSSRYVTDIIILLKGIFKYAQREYSVKNVFDGLIMPKNHKSEVRLLTEAEQETLKKHIADDPNKTNIGIALCLYTGLRIGELCALMWKDIDLKKRVLTVSRTIQRINDSDENGTSKTKLVITEPKSESSKRTIPIPACFISMLEKHKTNDNCYLLSGKNKPIEPRTMQYRFAKLLKNVGLPSVHFHSLRHAFATSAIALGFDVKTLSELLGHSTIELTLNRYVHSSMERKRSCMDMLEWSA